jgi:hypothetical protein
MSDYIFQTKAAEEAAIARFAARAAKRASLAFIREGLKVDSLAATDIHDECREHAYDILLVVGGEPLVDLLLGDVTESAVTILM